MANRQITYGIGFNVNNSGLGQLKQELSRIQTMTAKEFQIFNPEIDSLEVAKAKLKEVQEETRKVEIALQNSFNIKLNTTNLQEFQNQLAKQGTSIKQISTQWSTMGDTGKSAFRKLTTELLTTNKELKETWSVVDKIGETFANTIRWSVTSSAINTVTGAIQKAWGYSQKLDSSLNDIRIVTEKSADEMERFAKQANKAAKELGASTTSYSNAALIYYQQGLEEEDVQARTQATVKAANVTGQSAAEVSEQLTAVWNGYKVVASEAETYVDKLAAVAATTAADLEELSDGMSKVSSSANAMGVDIDQLSAQLATIVSVTRQDASLVGTALKTIYARMGDLKVSGVDEFGTSLGDVSGQMRQMGIEVLDQEGNLREMGEVIEEVASKWDTWTGAQQQAAAIAIAGKRQYNNLIALFENWDMYESALTTSQTSAGTLQKQQDIYMESIEAHLNELRVAGEKVYKELFDSEGMKDMIDFATLLVDKFGDLLDTIGGGSNALLLMGSAMGRLLGPHVAKGLSTWLINRQNLKYNEQQLHAEMQTTKILEEENIKISDAGAQKIIELKKKQLQLQKAMSQEELKASNERIVAVAKEIEAFEKATKALDELNETFAGEQKENDLEVGIGRDSKTGKFTKKGIHLKQRIDYGIEGYRGDLDEDTKEEIDNKKKEYFNRTKKAQEKANKLNTNFSKIAFSDDYLDSFENNEINAFYSGLEEEQKNIKDKYQKELLVKQNQKREFENKVISGESPLEIDNAQENVSIVEKEIATIEEKIAKLDLLDSTQKELLIAEQELEKATKEEIEFNKQVDQAINDSIIKYDELIQKKKEAAEKSSAIGEDFEFLAGFTDQEVEATQDLKDLQVKYNTNDIKFHDSGAVNIEGTETALTTELNQLNEVDDEDKDFKKIAVIEEQIAALERLKKAHKNVQDARLASSKSISEYLDLTQEELGLTDEEYKAFKKVVKEYGGKEKLQEDLKKSTKELGKEEEKLAKVLEKSGKILKNSSKEGLEFAKKVQEDRETSAEAKRKEEEEAAKEAEERMKKSREMAIKTGTELAGQVISLIGIFATFSSQIKSIFTDESLEPYQKVGKIFSALGTIIIGLLTTIPALITTWKTLNETEAFSNSLLGIGIKLLTIKDAKEKEALLTKLALKLGIDAETWSQQINNKEKLKTISAQLLENASKKKGISVIYSKIAATVAETMANYGLQASMWPILVIGLLIVAAFAALAATIMIVVGVIKLFQQTSDNGKKALEKAAKAAQSATEEFNRTKEAYEELKDSLEDYNNAQKAIEEMTAGTQEWKDAIEAANLQVLELMNRYPMLAEYIDNIDGQLKISKEGQETLLEESKKTMNTANRNQMALQAIELEAKNKNIALEGSANSLGADKAASTGLALGMTLAGLAAVIPGVRVLAGAGAAAMIGGGYAYQEAADQAYQNAITVVNKHGNAILESEDSFKEAMKEMGTSSEALIKALLQNKDELAKNAAEVAANSKAINALKHQEAVSYLNDNSDIYNKANKKEKNIIENFTKQILENSDLDEEYYQKYKKGFSNENEIKRIGKEYAKLMGIDFVGNVQANKGEQTATFRFSDGNTKEINVETMARALAEEKEKNILLTDENIQNLLKTFENAISTWGQKFGKEAGNALGDIILGGNFFALNQKDMDKINSLLQKAEGINTKIVETEQISQNAAQNAANLAMYQNRIYGGAQIVQQAQQKSAEAYQNQSLTEDEYAQLFGFATNSDFEAFLKSAGIESREAFHKLFKEQSKAYSIEYRKLGTDLSSTVRESFDPLVGEGGVLENASLDFKKNIAAGLTNVFEVSGTQGLDALTALLADENGLDEEEFNTLMEIFNNVDFSTSLGINDFILKIKAAGINISSLGENWDNFILALSQSANPVYDIINNLDKLRNSLKSLKDILNDLKVGDVISEEDYQLIISKNAELSKFFVATVDGYVRIGQAGFEAAVQSAKTSILDIQEIKDAFDEAEQQGNNLKGRGFVTESDLGGFEIAEGREEDFRNALRATKDLVNASGKNADLYVEKLNEMKIGKSSNEGFEAFTISSLRNIDVEKGAQALAKREGKNWDSLSTEEKEDYKRRTQEAKDAAEKRYNEANDYVTETENAVLSTLNIMENPEEWQQKEIDAQTIVITSQVNSYKELIALNEEYFNKYREDIIESTELDKLKTMYLAQEAEALGISGKAWEKYIATQEDFNEQDALLEKWRLKALYSEIDAYADLNAEISRTEKTLEDLESAQEKAFGKDAIDNLQTQIEAQKDLQEIYEKQAERRQKQWEAEAAGLAVYTPIVGEIKYNEDGTISDDFINKLLNQLIADPYNEVLEEAYNAIVGYNEKVLDGVADNEQAIADSREAIFELELEKFNKEFELIDQARDTLKEWQDFRTEMAKVLNGAKGGAAFGELSFEENFENLTKNIAERYGESFEKADFSGLTKIDQLNSLKINPTAENNPFYDMEKINSIAKDWYESNTDGNWETANDTQKKNVYDLLFGQGQLDGAFNEAAFNEQMGEAVSTAEDQITEAYDSLSELYELWLSGVEELSTLYQDQIDKLSNVNSLLSGSASLWKLVGKRIEGASDAVRNANENMVDASINSAEIARRQAAALKVQYETVKDSAEYSDEQKEAIYSAYMEAQQSALDLASEAINKISEVFTDNIALAIDDALAEVADNRTLAMLNEDWSRATAYDDRYLDEVNTAYAMDELDRAFQKSIDETDNIAAQNKLKQKQMEIEQRLNRILEERGKLSQAEIDRANAEYELTLKQIALEEAQRTASKMKLVRDSQGNYTYQYVADQDTVAEAKAEVAAAENDLYNLEKDQQKTAISDWFAMLQQAQTDIASAQATGDAEYVKKVIEYYRDSLSKLQSEITENPSEAFGEYANIIKNFDVNSLTADFSREAESAESKMIELQTTISSTLTEANEIANAELDAVKISMKTLEEKAENITSKLDEISQELLKYDLSDITDAVNTAAQSYVDLLMEAAGLKKDPEDDKDDSTTKAIQAVTKSVDNQSEFLVQNIATLGTLNTVLTKGEFVKELNFEIKLPEDGENYSNQIVILSNNNPNSTNNLDI